MRPGVDVVSRALPPPRSAPTDTGVGFVVGATAQGDPVTLTHSLTEYTALVGGRTAGHETTYDAADAFFREGGNMLYVARTNLGATADDDLNAMTREQLDSVATDYGLTPGDYATKADEVTAIEAAIAAGPAVDVGVAGALAALTSDYGPGQVFIADGALAGNADNQAALLAHAAAANRVALLSTPDGDEATLAAAGTALQTDAYARYGALFAPSAVIPGITPGTTRTVPYAAIEAGIIARNDVSFNPDVAAAGVLGQAVYALDVNGRYSDAEYETLNDAGVNMARVLYGGVRTYGYRSLVDGTADDSWLWFGYARLNMAIVAQADAIGERYVFSQLDGKGRTLSQFGGELSAMLATFYDAGALYGDTAQDAYYVDVGSTVNTPATIANGELHAVLAIRMSPGAEWVEIEIAKVATTQTLPSAVVVAA